MVDKKTFRKMERVLYNYYETLKDIEDLALECEELEKQREQIGKDIKETNVFIQEESKSITYGERVQTCSDNISYVEIMLIKEIDKLEQEWKYVRKKLLKRRCKIRELSRQVIGLNKNIKMLREEDKSFIELKYRDKKSIDEIADILLMARSTAYRKWDDLLENMAQFCNIVK